jgi:hypothetical protein
MNINNSECKNKKTFSESISHKILREFLTFSPKVNISKRFQKIDSMRISKNKL